MGLLNLKKPLSYHEVGKERDGVDYCRYERTRHDRRVKSDSLCKNREGAAYQLGNKHRYQDGEAYHHGNHCIYILVAKKQPVY